jgi:hypothetical protein
MENETENFEQLQRLLKLKRHETPPAGYFNHFSRNVISGIRTQQNRRYYADPMAKLNAEAPWLMRLWQWLEAKPAFAGAVGAMACAVIIGGIVLAEKPSGTNSEFAVTPGAGASPFAGVSAAVPDDLNSSQPMVMAASNSLAEPPKNLFDLAQPGQALPAGFAPGN